MEQNFLSSCLPAPDISSFIWKYVGLLHIKGFAINNLETLRVEFNNLLNSKNSNKPLRAFVSHSAYQSKTFTKLVEDLASLEWLEKVCGVRSRQIAGDITKYSGVTHWHRDIRKGSLEFAKLVVYLDPAQPSTFDFKYLPGSHQMQDCRPEGDYVYTSSELESLIRNQLISTLGYPSVKISAGDAIIFSPRLLHSVSDMRVRRQFAAIFSEIPISSKQRIEYSQMILAGMSIL